MQELAEKASAAKSKDDLQTNTLKLSEENEVLNAFLASSI